MKKKKKQQKERKKKRIHFKNIPIGRKYIFIFVITVLLFTGSATNVYNQMQQSKQDLEIISENSNRVNMMTEMSSIVQTKDVQIADYLLTGKTNYIDAFTAYQAELSDLIKQAESNLKTDEQKELLRNLQNNDENINNTFDKIIEAMENEMPTMATSSREMTYQYRTDNLAIIEELTALVKSDQEKAIQNTTDSMNNGTMSLAIANTTALILGFVLFYFVNRAITSNLKKVVGITSRIADGDLTIESMNYHGKDEIGQLAASVNQMKDNMKKVLQNIAEASGAVSSQSEELTQSAHEVKEGNKQIAITMAELSAGAENQANSATELTENMNQFIQTIQKSEDNGKEIETTSRKVLSLTADGTDLMKDSVKQMKQIDLLVASSVDKVKSLDKQSKEISNLVSVIKDIADQTNLLSLNAAIEAARAGEHGKGFAVVAEEVRKLSDQVTASVGEITTIVTNIQAESQEVVSSLTTGYHEVQEGSKQIEATGRNFDTITNSVSEMVSKIGVISTDLKGIAENSSSINKLIELIASVSEESASGVEEVAASSQQTASSMEEVSLSAEELAKLAEQLNERLQSFKL